MPHVDNRRWTTNTARLTGTVFSTMTLLTVSFEHCVPCDTGLAYYYISARHLDCMRFGDGTAADMQLGPLLFLQVSAVCLI